jgi:hypothetical protein
MATAQSLDELIARKAVEFADQVKKAAALADKEEEIRIEVEKQLAFIQKEAGVELHGKHEFTVAKGRVDSVYASVLIEYKNPSDPGARIGPKADSPGSKKVVEQIKSRFRGMKDEHGHPLNSLFGVGLDGKHFIFVRFRDGNWQVQEPAEVNRYSAERFLWALFNLGQKGKPFSPDYLAGDFGANEASIAVPGVHALYEAIRATDNPKGQTFFKQWKILFGEVCGYDVDNPSDKVKKLADSYGVALKGLRPAELLFALHSYYALFMKLLAAETVAFFYRGLLKSQVQRLMQAGTSAKLKRELEDLEGGSIFRQLNITNFLEGDLFAWYTSVWSDPVEKLVRDMVTRLDQYNPGTLSEDPVTSRDLLKKLYQQLFPKSVRHDLGEYYTPDWLAEHVLNELGYAGDPDKRLLDPACGSGTFLVMAINRIKKWHEDNRERCAYDQGDLCRKILANVVGFDLNPLAVMAARTNYLIAIRDLVSHADKVEIPVYLCDSIMTPSEYGLFSGTSLAQTKELKTAAANFLIPTEIAASRDDVAKYAEQIEFGVRNGYSAGDFLARCRDEGLSVSNESIHSELYDELVKLDKANKNGVWARIIKNSFAPLFIGKVDYVAGNPPWVNWESLPKEYRDSTIGLWDKYRLRERATPGARLGNVKKELSVLFVYVAAEHYLADKGKLGFIITQSIFKSGANEGFRRFAVSAQQPFRVERVSDLSLFLPFENAINRTAVLIAEKGKKTKYPVSYRLWAPTLSRPNVPEADLETVQDGFKMLDWLAAPVEPSVPESTWLTAPSKPFPVLQRIEGDRSSAMMDRTYAGSCTWLNGVYWVESITPAARTSLIRNLGDVGRKRVDTVTVQVENEFLFPLLRGRDVRAWSARPSAMILVPHDKNDFGTPVPLASLKQRYPHTFAFFKRFEQPLKSRSGYKQLHRSRPEFYVMGNVGNYTLSPYKVVFKELTEVYQCAVVGPPDGGSTRPIIPDHKLAFIACDSKDEAYYLAGMLNAIPTRVALYCASVGVQTQSYSPTDVSRVQTPAFRPSDSQHRAVTRLSESCHEMASRSDETRSVEQDLAQAVAAVWGISKKDLDPLLKAYDEILRFRGRRGTDSGGNEED